MHKSAIIFSEWLLQAEDLMVQESLALWQINNAYGLSLYSDSPPAFTGQLRPACRFFYHSDIHPAP